MVMLSLRKGLYITMMIPALIPMSVSTLGRQVDQHFFAVIASLLVWFILFFLFIWLCFVEAARESIFFMTCIYHLFCIGTVATFLNSLKGKDTDALLLWIPIASQLGIFVAIGLQECALALCWRFRGLLLSLLDASQLFFSVTLEGLRGLLAELGGDRLPT